MLKNVNLKEQIQHELLKLTYYFQNILKKVKNNQGEKEK